MSPKRCWPIALLAIVLAGPASPVSAAVLRGTVVDSSTGRPVAGAKVSAYELTQALLSNLRDGVSQGLRRVARTTTSAEGAFQIQRPSGVQGAIRIEAWGYYPLNTDLPAGGEPQRFELLSKIDINAGKRRDKVLRQVANARDLMQQANFLKAQKIVARLVRKYPHSAFLHNMNGMCLMRLDQIDEAEAELLEARRINPGDPAPPINLAMLYNHKGAFSKAVAAANQALKIDPYSAKANFLLGEARYRLRDLDAAETDLNIARDLDPHLTPELPIYLGNIYLVRKNYRDALTIYEQVLIDFPNVPRRAALERVIDDIRNNRFSEP